ncbi:hypothetical protein [Streptomyces sp. NPDC057748]|uniref:hypothetical protein n=1 Tax=unclassified Streptomyces TaxID=2593676 RepID=UPI0036D17A79
MSDFEDGPLKWETPGGYTPESVRRASWRGSIPVGAVKSMLDAADEAHLKSLYAENARGGEARQVVADVARILGTDIDDGPGHRWDADHMQRVVVAARRLTEALVDEGARNVVSVNLLRTETERADAAIRREDAANEAVTELREYARQMEQERDDALSKVTLWKELAERNDEASGPLRMELSGAQRERDQYRRDAERASEQLANVRELLTMRSAAPEPGDLVEELEAVIVSQAREIARLKGESA